MTQVASNKAAYIWSLADLLRGDFKQSQYGRIILPFTLLRRLEAVLAPSKEAVLAQWHKIRTQNLSEEAQEKMLIRVTGGLTFFNTSPMDLSKLGESGIKDNLEAYLQAFSREAREIFEQFKFLEFVGRLSDANLLYKIVSQVKNTDLSPEAISNYEMGLIFEELIRRFAESSNETAGEHFTPRDIVRLTTALVFMEDDEALSGDGIIRMIYDPTAGTGGFLSSGMEYVHELNPQAAMRTFGQELNPESYAICKADMLIKGQDVSQIKLGNTLSEDQLAGHHYDYMLSNPPFGVDWKKIEKDVKDEHTLKGFKDNEHINFAKSIIDRVQRNDLVMTQIQNNPKEQAMMGDFPKTVDNALIDNHETHQKLTLPLLSDPQKAALFREILFDLIKQAS